MGQKIDQEEIGKYYEIKENKNAAYHNVQDAIKACLGKFIALNTYVRQREWSQVNGLTFHLKKQEEEKQTT